MKKILFAIGILAGLLTATQNVQAQDKAKDNAQTQTQAKVKVYFGIKAGVNISSLDYEGWEEDDKKAGIFFGPMLDIALPSVAKGFGVDVAVLYSKRGTNDYEQSGLEVPINLKYGYDLYNFLGIFATVGPDLYFNFKESSHKSIDNQVCQLGLNLGAGLKIIQHIQVSFNYQWGLTPTYKASLGDPKTNTWQIAVAYVF